MKLNEGRWYQRRDGKITGVLVLTKDQDAVFMQMIAEQYPFYDPKFKLSYTNTGSFNGAADDSLDLVCEVSQLPDKITNQAPSTIAWA